MKTYLTVRVRALASFLIFMIIIVLCAGAARADDKKAHFIPIHGEIDRALTVFLRRSIEKAYCYNEQDQQIFPKGISIQHNDSKLLRLSSTGGVFIIWRRII